MQYTISVKGACESLDLGRTTLFALLKSNQLTAIRVGRRTLVLTSSIRDFVARKEAEQR